MVWGEMMATIKSLNLGKLALLIALYLMGFTFPNAFAAQCFDTSITSPSPFMGNNNEVFRTAEGNVWQVKFAYEYMYEYYPSVMICDESKLIIKGKALDIVKVGTANSQKSAPQSQIASPKVKVVMKPKGCRGYFLADGDAGGIYLLEWYGGYDPDVGDSIVGEMKSYGFKDIFYPEKNASGRVYVDDYSLSKSRALEKLSAKCR